MAASMVWVWIVLLVAVVLAALLALVARRLQTTRVRLDRMESRLASVLEGSDAGLAVWDPNGRLVACNKRFREFYPTVELKPGLVFEDLTRFTATRGVIQLPDDQVETWVEARLDAFAKGGHDLLRTSDGRWLDVDTRPTGSGEVLLLYTDTTDVRETEASLSDRSKRLERQAVDRALLTDAIRIGSTATTPGSAMAAVVALVCAWAAWPVGYAYRVSGRGDDATLVPIPAWCAEPDAGETFSGLRAIVEERQLKAGEGIAGRTLYTGRVSWVPNVAVDPSIDAEVLDRMTGIRGACAVPVRYEDTVVAVLEFLARDQLVPDPSMTHLLEATAEMLGWVWGRGPTPESDDEPSDRLV